MNQMIDKVCAQILKLVPLTLAIFVPLFFLPITADTFNLNKLSLVAVLASLSLIAWSIKNLVRGKLNITVTPSSLPFFVLVLAFIVSSLWLSSTPHLSLFGQTSLIISLVIIFFTTTSSQKNSIVIKSIVYGLITSSTLLSLFTILARFGLVAKMVNSSLLQDSLFNPAGGILPAISFTIPVLIATVVYAATTQNRLNKAIFFFLSVLMIVGSVINISLLLPQNGQTTLYLLPYLASWSIAIDTLKNWQTALLGTGPETYFSTFTRLRPAYLNLDKSLWTVNFSESGSFLMTLLTTSGLLGALSFIIAFLKPIIASLQIRSKVTDRSSFLFLLTGSLSALLITLLLPIGIVSLTLGFLLLIGLTVQIKLQNQENLTKDISISLSTQSEPSNPYQDLSLTSRFSFAAFVLPWITTLSALALLVFYWLSAIPSYAASITIKQASDLISKDAVASFLKQTKAAQLDPYNPTYPAVLSQTYQNLAKFYLDKKDISDTDKKSGADAMQRAVDYARLAAKLSPLDANVYLNLANIYQSFIGTATGASDYALSHYAQAISLDPTNPRIRLQLGILFFNLGDGDQAFKTISQAISLKQDWDLPYYNLAAIYKSKKDYSTALKYMQAGYQYTDPGSADLAKVQAEISSLEKLAPTPTPTATSSAKVK